MVELSVKSEGETEEPISGNTIKSRGLITAHMTLHVTELCRTLGSGLLESLSFQSHSSRFCRWQLVRTLIANQLILAVCWG